MIKKITVKEKFVDILLETRRKEMVKGKFPAREGNWTMCKNKQNHLNWK